MRKLVVLSLLVIACGALLWAKKPTTGIAEFTIASTSINSSGWLVVGFKEVGLTPGDSIQYTLSGNAQSVYDCLASGNRVVAGPYYVPGPDNSDFMTETNSEFITAPNGGSIQGSIVLAPPGSGSLSCLSGGTLTLVQVSYYGISLASEDMTTSTTLASTTSFTGICGATSSTSPCTDVLVSTK
jgi:hypothetical protein